MRDLTEIRYIVNENARKAGFEEASVEFINNKAVENVRNFHKSFPEYKVTPLQSLEALSKKLGVSNIWVKDESYRFGLNAFKVLGGSYAVGKYLAEKLDTTYGIVYRGAGGRVGHELILECRTLKEASGITETDIAKRLIDYGYHAPTLSFPVHGTLMIEPTESESLAELNQFLSAMIQIYEEIKEVSRGEYTKEDNVLVNAPHPEYECVADEWKHAYPRSKAAYPLPYVAANKFWVNVARIDNAFGDRNLVACLC